MTAAVIGITTSVCVISVIITIVARGVLDVADRGNKRRKIFFSKPDYERFKDYLRKAQDK